MLKKVEMTYHINFKQNFLSKQLRSQKTREWDQQQAQTNESRARNQKEALDLPNYFYPVAPAWAMTINLQNWLFDKYTLN